MLVRAITDTIRAVFRSGSVIAPLAGTATGR
jgi:hypothetical protein